jgi:hypothetical protein
MEQPNFTKQYLFEDSKELISMVNGLLETRGQYIPNLHELSFNVFGTKGKSIKSSIQSILDEIKSQRSSTTPQPETQPSVEPSGRPQIMGAGDEGKFPGKFPDEKHAYSTKKGGWYQYLGPGTHVDERVSRGDKPINGIDAGARIHDIQYKHMADTLERGGAVSQKQVRDSDLELIDTIQRKLSDEPIVGNVALLAMKNKIRLEDSGLMDYLRYVRNGGIE